MTAAWTAAAPRLVCSGCGADVVDRPECGELPFRCRHATAGDDIDHLVVRVLDLSAAQFPAVLDPNPFVGFRHLFYAYAFARARGLSDEAYIELVGALDREVARVDGTGFRVTPFSQASRLAERLGFQATGGVWVKDETGNVSGSHKARHLVGIMIYLRVLDAVGITTAAARPLAIASCGNAALAAGVVARAAGWPLQVFVPPDAPLRILDRLRELRASIVVCHRQPSEQGDPCYRRFASAVDEGALPFCCQGSANGLTIEGGTTLGYEMVAALQGGPPLDAVVVQVGGGALASAVIQAFEDACALGALTRLPRVYAVQTRGAYPLKRAYDAVVSPGWDPVGRLAYAATHRHEFMWPWESEPKSIARGILDDETYDWRAVVDGMIRSGGAPVVVDEEELVEANRIGRSATGIDVDATGTAGLAGLLRLRREGAIGAGEKVAVVFSGVERG